MRPTGSRRILLGGVLVVLTAGTIGAASAHWSGSGTGSGSGVTGTTQAVTLTSATAAAQLYPGGQAGVELRIANPNPGSVRIGSLALETTQGTGGFSVDAGHSACGVSSLAFTTQTNGGAGWTIPGSGSLPVTLTNALSMSTGAASACQGASFTVYLKAGV